MKPVRKIEPETVRPPSRSKNAPAISGTYSTAAYTVDVADLPYEEDELTPVCLACLVCKGRAFITKENGSHYAGTRCPWCTDGHMSGEQVNRYLNRDSIKKREVENILRRYVDE